MLTRALEALRRPRWFAALALLVGIPTLARGLSLPSDYASVQWLLTYRHGFVRRGLPGTLLQPWLRFKSGSEIAELLDVLGMATMAAGCAALALACWAPVRGRGSESRLDVGVWLVAVVVFLTSPVLVLAGATAGFQDHLLLVVTMGLLACLRAGLWWPVPLGAACALATHELYALYGLPVVGFAVLLQARAELERGASTRRVAARVLGVSVPVGLFGIYQMFAQIFLPLETIELLGADAVATGAFSPHVVDIMTRHLTEHVGESYLLQKDTLPRIWGPGSPAVFPATVFLGALATAAMRWPPVLTPVLWLVIAAPLGLHLLAWDHVRFNAFTTTHALLCCTVATAYFGSDLGLGRRSAGATALAGALVVLSSVLQTVPLIGRAVERDSLLAIRTQPGQRTFIGCPRLFPNSGFEKGSLEGWTAEGRAFSAGSVREVRPEGKRSRRGGQGRWYVTSWAERGGGRGRLSSPPFQVVWPTVLIAVGGHGDGDTYVRLLVDGEEVHRAAGSGTPDLELLAWDVREHVGRSAIIEVVDADPSGEAFVSVDGLCAFR